MEEFELKGQDGFLIIRINEVFGFPNRTSHFGGYDCVVGIDIKVGGYNVRSQFYSSTGELFDFYEKIKKCQTELNGLAEFNSYESNLELTVKYIFGKVSIWGKYQENLATDNIMEFDFNSDQSYLKNTVEQLNQIVNKYGGMQGIAKK
ncbi:hypothetical protein QMA06_15945 [Winogradskyella sp. APC 3343]|uniref:Uncharacterized protein n=2 Tax=Winogradskyella bathintestinalis TaxID=3035208 RepID=A0ABT7ZZN0_9FLAO|nr:hypothetical protein [Winogradskyella bathintestinalis]